MPAAFQNTGTVVCQLPTDGQRSDVMDLVNEKPIARWQIKVPTTLFNIKLKEIIIMKIVLYAAMCKQNPLPKISYNLLHYYYTFTDF